jgi:hypothetical protein
MPMALELRDLFLQCQPLEPLEAGDPRYVESFTVRGVSSLFARFSLPLAAPGRLRCF